MKKDTNHIPFEPADGKPAPTSVVATSLAALVAPVWNSGRSRDYTVPVVITAKTKADLTDRMHLRDCSSLGLSQFSLTNRLVAMTGGKSHVTSKIRDILGVTMLGETARMLSKIARQEPEFVRAAMEGRLAAASALIPPQGFADYDRGEVIALLGQVAHAHMVANMLRAAKVVFSRLHEPSGHSRLDDNAGGVVTVGSAARALKRETIDITNVIKLERDARERELTAPEIASLEKLGFADNARALEDGLREIYGDSFDPWYEEMMGYVGRWTSYIRRASSVLGKAKAMNTRALHLLHGPEALPTFYLSVLQAIAWTRFYADTATSPLDDAVLATANGGVIVLPATHKTMVPDARELFFWLRTFYARDSRSFLRRVAKSHPYADHQAMAFAEHRRQMGMRRGQEPFRIALIVTAARRLATWIDANPGDPEAQTIRGETLGSILVQLRV